MASTLLARRFGVLAANCSARGLSTAASSTTVAPSTASRMLGLGLGVGAGLTASTMVVAYADKPQVDYAEVKKSIGDILDDPTWDDGSWGPVFVRLAWHQAGTYAKADNSGGSEGGRMRFEPEASWGANAGLGHARAYLEPIKEKHPGISYADLYALAGYVAIEEMGGPELNFRPGRSDAPDGSTSPPDGRLPDADGRNHGIHKSGDHLRDIFYRMGFSDREIVALSGAHALGRCHTDRSGYWGPWTRAPTTFSNEYFRLLLEEKWTRKNTHNGQVWTGPLQYEDSTKELMMLPTDLALVQDDKFRPIVEEYAKNEEVFFKDFAKAFTKLQELGVPALKPWWRRMIGW